MDRKLDSTRWTGDYPAKAHFPLASAEERKRHWRIIRGSVVIVLVVVGAGLAWQVLA